MSGFTARGSHRSAQPGFDSKPEVASSRGGAWVRGISHASQPRLLSRHCPANGSTLATLPNATERRLQRRCSKTAQAERTCALVVRRRRNFSFSWRSDDDGAARHPCEKCKRGRHSKFGGAARGLSSAFLSPQSTPKCALIVILVSHSWRRFLMPRQTSHTPQVHQCIVVNSHYIRRCMSFFFLSNYFTPTPSNHLLHRTVE